MRKLMKEKKLNVPNYFRVDPNDFYGKYQKLYKVIQKRLIKEIYVLIIFDISEILISYLNNKKSFEDII